MEGTKAASSSKARWSSGNDRKTDVCRWFSIAFAHLEALQIERTEEQSERPMYLPFSVVQFSLR